MNRRPRRSRAGGTRRVKQKPGTAAIQASLARIAKRLQVTQQQARALLRALPRSPERDAMQEDDIAPDVATDLVGAIECLVADCLQPALRIAREAARLTDAKLRREWRRRQRERRAAGRPSAGEDNCDAPAS